MGRDLPPELAHGQALCDALRRELLRPSAAHRAVAQQFLSAAEPNEADAALDEAFLNQPTFVDLDFQERLVNREPRRALPNLPGEVRQ